MSQTDITNVGCPSSYSIAANDTSKYCGTSSMGGDSCKVDCCNAQSMYCGTACSWPLAPADCFAECVNQRGCGTYEPAPEAGASDAKTTSAKARTSKRMQK